MKKINLGIKEKDQEFNHLLSKKDSLTNELNQLKSKNEELNKKSEKLTYQNNLKKKL